MRSIIVKRALSSTFMAGLMVSAAPAFAQDTVAQDSDDDITQDAPAPAGQPIVVTGTRLNVNPNLEGAAPVLSVGEEEIAARGTTRIEDLTNQLPQVFAGQAGEVSNGASGTATLDLRGLGATRTLVLINGRRLPYGASTVSAPNLDLIPTQLVERVDILTGGASAVYGSDAVAGVANFVLKQDFEGFELDVQAGAAQNGNDYDYFENVLAAGGQPIPGPAFDGRELNVTAILGANTADDRGNVTIYGSYETRDSITQDNRVISGCAIGPSSNPNSSFGGAGCVGSGNFRLFAGDGGAFFQQADGTIVPYVGGPAQTFNFGPANFFQRPSERFQIVGSGRYEVTDNMEVFGEVSYTDNVSDAQVAPTASFGSYSINCDNPFLAGNPGESFYDIFGCSAADVANGTVIDGITASHRNVEGGARNSRLENSAFRLVGGVRGDLGSVWSYEAFGQYAETSDTSISTNDFIVSNLQQALFAVDDGTGNVVCQDQSGGCVPYNIFQRNPDGTSLVTQEQAEYLQGVGIVVGSTSQLVAGATVQADLGNYGIQSPLADDGVAFLVGGEFRRDSLQSNPDEISQVPGGGFTGVGGATLPVSGDVEVVEGFGELQIPLVSDVPFIRELTLSGQYRYSDYSASGNNTTNNFSTDTYGVSLTWAPNEDVTLRGQYQRAVRAPNIIELYTGQDVNLANLDAGTNANGATIYDPCATNAPTASAAACALTGVTAGQYGNILDVISGQTQVITGGNTNLRPEVSDTYTFGIVATPAMAPGLSVSVDYFDISIEDFIAAGIGVQTTLDNCLATGDDAFCGLIQRDARGTLVSGTAGVGFVGTNLNIATLETTGFDVQVDYTQDFGFGDIRFNYAATILNTLDDTSFPGGDVNRCAGFAGSRCGTVNPEYRHRLLASFEAPFGVDATVTWRFFGASENAAGSAPEIDSNFDAKNYIDLSLTGDLTDSIGVRAGVLNVTNTRAPVSSSAGAPFGNGNTYPAIYDTGRFFFVGFNMKL